MLGKKAPIWIFNTNFILGKYFLHIYVNLHRWINSKKKIRSSVKRPKLLENRLLLNHFQHIIGCCPDGGLEGGGEEGKGGGEEEQGDEDTEGHQECGIADHVDVDSCYASWSTNAIPFAISFGGGLFCDLVCSFL